LLNLYLQTLFSVQFLNSSLISAAKFASAVDGLKSTIKENKLADDERAIEKRDGFTKIHKNFKESVLRASATDCGAREGALPGRSEGPRAGSGASLTISTMSAPISLATRALFACWMLPTATWPVPSAK